MRVEFTQDFVRSMTSSKLYATIQNARQNVKNLACRRSRVREQYWIDALKTLITERDRRGMMQ